MNTQIVFRMSSAECREAGIPAKQYALPVKKVDDDYEVIDLAYASEVYVRAAARYIKRREGIRGVIRFWQYQI